MKENEATTRAKTRDSKAWAVSEAEPEVPGAGVGAAISFPPSIEVGLPTGDGEMAAPKKKKKTIQDYAVHLN